MASLDTERSNAVDAMRAALVDGEVLRAADYFRLANELEPGDEDLAIEYGEALGRLGRYDPMALVIEAALEQHPESAQLHRLLGWARMQLKEMGPAADELGAALRLEPDDEEAAHLRVSLLQAVGRLDEARETVNSALQHHPESTRLHVTLGTTEGDGGHWEAALAAFSAAARLDPADPSAVLGRAEALIALQRAAEAQAVMETAVRADPRSAAFRDRLAWVQLIRGRNEDAVASFAAAAELGEDGVWTIIGHARALRAVARYGEAGALIGAALEATPDEPALQEEAGAIARATHDYAAATTAFARALELNPKSTTARREMKRTRLRTGYWRMLQRPSRAYDRATRRMFADATPVLAVIDEMRRLDAPTRTAVKASIADLAWRRARVSASVAVVTSALGALWALALVGIALAVPWVLGRQGGSGGLDGFDLVIAYVVALWLVLIAAGFVLTVVPAGRATTFGTIAVALVYGAFAGAAAGSADSLGPTAASLIVWSLTAIALSMALILAFATVLVAGEGAGLRYIDRRRPHTACLHALAQLLAQLTEGIVLTDRGQVARATAQLERAAAMLRAHLKGEPTGDLRTDAWLAKRADGHAEALRECKKALLSPGVGSLDTLRRRLGDDVVQVARGLWRHLTWIDPGPAAAKTRRLRVRTVTRTGVIALAPLAIVLLISGQGWFGLGGDAADELKLIALGWAFLSILMPLDPGFNEKFAALRGGAELLRPGGPNA